MTHPENCSRPVPSLPLVTIGLPVYNGAKHLKRALGSLLDQDYPNIEIVVSDNASTDLSLKICRRVLRDRPGDRIIEQPMNRGPHANFQAVLDAAHGQYFMWAADDDMWRRTFVSRLVAELEAHPEACVAMSGVERRFEDDTAFDVVRFIEDQDPNDLPPSRLGPLTMTGKFNLFIYGLYRTEILRKGVAHFPRTLGGDRMLVSHFAYGHRFRYVDELLYVRTHRPDHAEAYEAEAAMAGAKLRQVAAFAKLMVRSDALPLSCKLGLPRHVLDYARFVYRKEAARLDELLNRTRPSLKSRKRDALILTLLGLAGSIVLAGAVGGWAPRAWLGVGVLAVSLSVVMLMVLQVRLALATNEEQERMREDLHSARKKLRILGDLIEKDRDQAGLDRRRVRKLLASSEQVRAALLDLAARLDPGPVPPRPYVFDDNFVRPIDLYAGAVAEDGAEGFTARLAEDPGLGFEAPREGPGEAAPGIARG